MSDTSIIEKLQDKTVPRALPKKPHILTEVIQPTLIDTSNDINPTGHAVVNTYKIGVGNDWSAAPIGVDEGGPPVYVTPEMGGLLDKLSLATAQKYIKGKDQAYIDQAVADGALNKAADGTLRFAFGYNSCNFNSMELRPIGLAWADDLVEAGIYDDNGNQLLLIGNVLTPKKQAVKDDGTPLTDVEFERAIKKRKADEATAKVNQDTVEAAAAAAETATQGTPSVPIATNGPAVPIGGYTTGPSGQSMVDLGYIADSRNIDAVAGVIKASRKANNKLKRNIYDSSKSPSGLEIKEDTPASIYIYADTVTDGERAPKYRDRWNKWLGSDIGRTRYIDSFILRSVRARREEKSHVFTALSDYSSVFFFGEMPVVYTMTGVVLDSSNQEWFNDFYYFYDQFLRGTSSLQNRSRIFLSYADQVIEGYLVNTTFSQTGEQPNAVEMGFDMILIQRTTLPSYTKPIERKYPGLEPGSANAGLAAGKSSGQASTAQAQADKISQGNLNAAYANAASTAKTIGNSMSLMVPDVVKRIAADTAAKLDKDLVDSYHSLPFKKLGITEAAGMTTAELANSITKTWLPDTLKPILKSTIDANAAKLVNTLLTNPLNPRLVPMA